MPQPSKNPDVPPLPAASATLRRPSAASRRASLWIVLGLALGPAAALGFGRFAYALLLPSMRTDLGWTYAEAGAMNGANALGYLGGALIAAAVARKLGTKRTFMLALAATAAALLLSAAVRSFPALLTLRLSAGATGALVFVAGGGLAAMAGLADTRRAALLLAIYFAGPGIGIFLSGPIVWIGTRGASADWPGGWLALGGATLLAGLAALPALARASSCDAAARADLQVKWRPLAPLFIAYALFGSGYIAYMTFIVAFLRNGGFTETQITVFWAILGAAAVIAAFAWGPILARLPAGGGIFAVLLVLLVGAILPLVSSGAAAAFLSAALFGGSFLAVVTAITHVARQVTPPASWTHVIGALTVAFALGQCLGPILAGVLSDSANGLRAGMVMSVILLASAALVALRQPPSPN
jgi:predicted MFS family arabinose efflux permease